MFPFIFHFLFFIRFHFNTALRSFCSRKLQICMHVWVELDRFSFLFLSNFSWLFFSHFLVGWVSVGLFSHKERLWCFGREEVSTPQLFRFSLRQSCLYKYPIACGRLMTVEVCAVMGEDSLMCLPHFFLVLYPIRSKADFYFFFEWFFISFSWIYLISGSLWSFSIITKEGVITFGAQTDLERMAWVDILNSLRGEQEFSSIPSLSRHHQGKKSTLSIAEQVRKFLLISFSHVPQLFLYQFPSLLFHLSRCCCYLSLFLFRLSSDLTLFL